MAGRLLSSSRSLCRKGFSPGSKVPFYHQQQKRCRISLQSRCPGGARDVTRAFQTSCERRTDLAAVDAGKVTPGVDRGAELEEEQSIAEQLASEVDGIALNEADSRHGVITPGQPKKINFWIGAKWKSLDEIKKSSRSNWAKKWLSLDDDIGEDKLEDIEHSSTGETESKVGEDEMSKDLEADALESQLSISMVSFKPNSPQTLDLVQHLRANFNLLKTHLSLYEKFPPTLFGSSREWVDRRAAKLREVGFVDSEADFVLSIFPPALDVDVENIFAVHAVFKKLSFSRIMIHALMKRESHLFLMDAKKLEERLQALRDAGLIPRKIASLLLQFPVLVSVPLTAETMNVIKTTREAGCGSQWVGQTLLNSMHYRPARIELGQDCEKIVRLLRKLEVNTDSLLIHSPQLFQMNADHLSSIILILFGSPLYCNVSDVQRIIGSVPDFICGITNTDSLRADLDSLSRVCSSSYAAYRAVSTFPSVLGVMRQAGEKLKVMAEEGISSEDQKLILSRVNYILLQHAEEEFRPRLRFLFSIPGVTPDTFRELDYNCIRRLFTTHLDTLKARLNYAKKYNENLVSSAHLRDLFCSSDKELAEQCGKSLLHYHQSAGHRKQFRRRGRLQMLPSNYAQAPEPDTTTGSQEATSGGVVEEGEESVVEDQTSGSVKSSTRKKLVSQPKKHGKPRKKTVTSSQKTKKRGGDPQFRS